MIRFLGLLLFAPALFGQTADAVLTQTLIAEIRALRQDLEATNVTSQRVQIALYRLQSQTAIVNTAQQRFETARTRLAETQAERRRLTGQARIFEEATSGPIDNSEKAQMQRDLPHLKSVLETAGLEEATRQSAANDAESQLRTEQVRLAELQALLDRLDRALEELARPKK